MCTLLTLPNEILLQIIAETCPDGIEELDLCCKSLHKLARESMTQHKADRKDYWGRFLAWPRYSDVNTFFAPGQPFCLSEIMFRPRLAYYVQHLCVRFSNLPEPPRASEPFHSLAMTTQDSAWQDFLAISKCPYISAGDDSAHWQEMLDRADPQTVTCLLLTLLPNLRTFYLSMFGDSSQIIRVVNSIASASQPSNRINAQPNALSKLCFFRVCYASRHATAGLWESFARLPSMRCMRHGPFVREDLERSYSHEPGSSKVTELQFECGDLAIETLTRLCSHIQILEKFVYNDTNGPTEDYCRFSDLTSLLQTYAGHSLKELCLRTQESYGPVGPFVQNFVGPLHGFGRLEKIEITFDALVRETAGTLAVPKLVDIMPASLRELHIWVPNVRRAVDLMGGLFAGIEECKSTKLPNIQLVVFRRRISTGDEMTELPLDNDTKLRCEDCGIALRGEGVGCFTQSVLCSID